MEQEELANIVHLSRSKGALEGRLHNLEERPLVDPCSSLRFWLDMPHASKQHS